MTLLVVCMLVLCVGVYVCVLSFVESCAVIYVKTKTALITLHPVKVSDCDE